MSPKTNNSASVLKCNVLCYAPLTTGYCCRPSCPGVKVINLLNDKWLYAYMCIYTGPLSQKTHIYDKGWQRALMQVARLSTGSILQFSV